jgi:hypothetical protein
VAHFNQIIVGSGISALTFAVTNPNSDPLRPRNGETQKTVPVKVWGKNPQTGKVEVVGKKDLKVMTPNYLDGVNTNRQMFGNLEQWHKFTFPNGGKTGQPTNLHQFPAQKTVAESKELGQFTSIGDLVGKIDTMHAKVAQQLAIGDALVDSVTRQAPGKLTVTLRGNPPVVHTANQVIIACGPGPEKQPDPALFSNRPDPNEDIPYSRFVSGVDFLFEKPKPWSVTKDLIVAVQGGSATAAWVCEKALKLGYRVIWHTRPDGAKFRDADPAGRNTQTINQFRDLPDIGAVGTFKMARLRFAADKHSVRFAANLRNVTFLAVRKDSRESPSIELDFGDERGTWYAHRYIYCLGADPTAVGGPAQILDRAIRNGMEPYWDIDQLFPVNSSENMGRAVLAICTPERDVWVIGSALHQALGMGRAGERLNSVQAGYKKLRETLPSAAGAPVEGLAGAVASIEALINYIPEDAVRGDDINFNTANQTQIAVCLANHKRWGYLNGLLRNRATQRIIEERTKNGKPFGITSAEVETIILDVVKKQEGLSVLPPEEKKAERDAEKKHALAVKAELVKVANIFGD